MVEEETLVIVWQIHVAEFDQRKMWHVSSVRRSHTLILGFIMNVVHVPTKVEFVVQYHPQLFNLI